METQALAPTSYSPESFNFLASLINENSQGAALETVGPESSFNFLASLINGNTFFLSALRLFFWQCLLTS